MDHVFFSTSQYRGQVMRADEEPEQCLLTVGRRKLLKPLYTEFAKTPEGIEKARNIYQKARPQYHSVTVNTIDKILG